MASRPYEARIAPGGTQALSQAGAQAFGAGVGDAMSGFGETVERAGLQLAEREREVRRNEDNAAFGREFAEYRLAATRDIRGYQEAAGAGAAGHDESVRTYLDTNGNALIEKYGADPVVGRAVAAQVRDFNTGTLAREEAWSAGKRIAKVGTDEKTAQDTDALRFSTATTLDEVNAFGIENDTAALARIGAYGNLDDEARGKLIDAHFASQDDAKFAAALRINPKGARAMLAAGAFPNLDPDRAERGYMQADAAIARDEAQARAQAAQAAAIAKDELGAAGVALDAGGGSVGDRLAVADRWEKLGDNSKAAEWRGKAQRFAATQGSADWTLPQIDAAIAPLVAKRNRGALSPTEAFQLDGLEEQRRTVAGQLDQSGGALLNQQYATGQALAPIDPADEVGMAARGKAAVAAASRAGRPLVEPILPNELKAYKDLDDGTVAGKINILKVAQSFGDPRAVTGAVRQIAGSDDGDLRIAVTLPEQAARDVIRGADDLKANGGVWNEKQAALVYQQHYRRTYQLLGEGYADDLFAAAKNLYAARMTRGGQTVWNAGRFAEAIENAAGRTKATDGTFRGGVARTARGIVVVPPGMAPEQLLERFARAAPKDYARASGGRHPVWADGKPLTEGQFKSQLLPTALPGGRYGFRATGGGLIQDDKGQPYTVDIGKLAR